MARPVNADATATRRRILDAAAQLFGELGPGGASMRRIAREAGVSLATVHHYFGNKQGLYDSCVAAMYSEFDTLRDELREALPGLTDPTALLEVVVRSSYRFACAHRPAMRLAMRDAIERGEITSERQQSLLIPGMEEGVQLLSAFSGRSELELRLAIRSVSYLIVRYALTGAAELALVLDHENEAAGQQAVEDHLVALTRALLSEVP